jgi:hypothetical protein
MGMTIDIGNKRIYADGYYDNYSTIQMSRIYR